MDCLLKIKDMRHLSSMAFNCKPDYFALSSRCDRQVAFPSACDRNSFMILKTQLRQYMAWLALFAVLFGSLAPSLAQASVALTGKQWVEICTATGTTHVQVDAGDESRTGAADVPEHCPFLLSLQLLSPVPSTALPSSPVPPACAVAFSPILDLPSLALQFRVAHPAHAPPSLS